MSAERVSEARRALLLVGPDYSERVQMIETFELAVRSDQRARDFPPATNIDATEDAA